jgi:hypothetical protein
VNLMCLFWPQWIWWLPLQQLLLKSQGHNHTPMFHYRLWYWRWSWGRLWLVLVPCRQKHNGPFGRRSLGTYFTEMCLMLKLSAKMHWTVPYDGSAISHMSWIDRLKSARIAYELLVCFLVLCLLTVFQNAHRRGHTFTHPSLNCLYHKKVSLWLMALSP